MIFVSVRRPLLNDQSPYMWKRTDPGRTWTKIITGIRPDAYVHAVREDPTRRGLLYAATQHGVYVSYDDGAQWRSLVLNMPDVPVSDLVVQDNELAIATHGRGFCVLDDVAALRQITPAIASSELYLFTPPAGVRSGPGVSLSGITKPAPKGAKLEILAQPNDVMHTCE